MWQWPRLCKLQRLWQRDGKAGGVDSAEIPADSTAAALTFAEVDKLGLREDCPECVNWGHEDP